MSNKAIWRIQNTSGNWPMLLLVDWRGWKTVAETVGNTGAGGFARVNAEVCIGVVRWNMCMYSINVGGGCGCGCVWVGVAIVPGLVGWKCVDGCWIVGVWEWKILKANRISGVNGTQSLGRVIYPLVLGSIEKWRSTCCTRCSIRCWIKKLSD